MRLPAGPRAALLPPHRNSSQSRDTAHRRGRSRNHLARRNLILPAEHRAVSVNPVISQLCPDYNYDSTDIGLVFDCPSEVIKCTVT